MNELSIIEMNDAGERWVSGRKLHALLRCATRYAMWFPRMCEFGFVENTDFRTFPKTVKRADGTEMPRCEIDHMLTVEMAKEICNEGMLALHGLKVKDIVAAACSKPHG